MVLADKPGALLPSNAWRASWKSPVLTPFRYSQGMSSSMLVLLLS